MARRLLLIGWEAADWRLLNPLLDSGQLPALDHLVEPGIVGDLLACQPLNAAAQWTSIITGKRPWQHGVTQASEMDANGEHLLPISRVHRRTAALWEMLAQRGRRSIIVGWPATHGSQADNVSLVSNRYSEPTAPPGVKPWPPARAGTYWPEGLRNRLDPLRVSPEDIGVEVIERYLPNWRKIDQNRDRRIGQLRVLLTLDFSNHAAITHLIRNQEWDFAAVRFPALGHIARLFLPFHHPRRDWISPRDFESYQDVIRVECQVLDQALAALRQAAGPEAAVMVVSAHGTRVPDVPPAGFPQGEEQGWKSPYGLIAASGPGFACDSLVQGASVLDVTPTLLTWFGLPFGDDMEGRVLLEGLVPLPEIQRLPTWEGATAVAPDAPALATGSTPAAKKLRLQAEWNWVQSCLEAGRFLEALPHLEVLFQAFPERPDYCHALFQCQLNLGRLAQAQTTLGVLVETVPAGLAALVPQAELAIAKRDLRQARMLVAEARRANLAHPVLARRLGLLLLRLREWDALADLARTALARDENDPIAWLGLAEANLRRQKPAEAEAHARRAIQLKYFLPEAHFVLTRALVAQSKWNEAREAMGSLRKLQPQDQTAAGYERRLERSLQSPSAGTQTP